VCGGDEEDANEKLGDEHGDVGGGSVWWCWCFNWVVDALERNPSSLLYPFSHFLRAREAITRHRLSPPPRPSSCFVLLLPSLSRRAAPVRSLPSFSLQFRSSSSHLAGNSISSPQFHHPSALADVCSDIGLFYCSQPPVRSLSLFSPSFHSSYSPLAGNPISSRQFHSPRALVDVCVAVDLSLLLGDLESLLGDVCLYLSRLRLFVGLLPQSKVESIGLQLRTSEGPENDAKELHVLSREEEPYALTLAF
jgi:hypothetical protein